ncbi:MAG: chemotaxis protein CheA [Desulfococcaceae bacterium]|jgi:two-component system chemotaxis sensor kinase CheA|nr:chemotaxis protein CheA [Desulfococcaceae bacterium]
MEDHSAIYKEETYELLAELETSLLELERTPDDGELIDQVFRSMHTIKGSGAMFGFENIAAFTHEIESVFDQVRDREIPVSKKLIDLTLAACDLIKKMVEGESGDAEQEQQIVRSFQEMNPVSDISLSDGKSRLPAGETDDDGTEHLYRIRFRPETDFFRNGSNPLPLLEELQAMGICEIIIHKNNIPFLADMEPETCYIYWDIFLSTGEGINAVRDVFIFAEDNCSLDIRVIDSCDGGASGIRDKKIGEILLEQGDITSDMIQKALNGQRRVGEMLLESKAIDPDTLNAALLEQKHIRDAGWKRRHQAPGSSLRVPAEKLDTLVNLVGELVTVQARLTRRASFDRDRELTAISEEVERLSAELRDNTMNIRMLPVGSTFRKFRRLIHDLSNELGKEVNVQTEGEETELDKTVIEQLNDPLVHIIRNALDHGIEIPEIREARGKPRQGNLFLRAERSGSDVLIRIADDGAGIDPEVIRNRAMEKGLISPESEYTENEILSMIFLPGFSTVRQVSGVSGRGVGMDVVRRRVENLRGTAEIESKKNAGTTVTLKLPLTLAIADGLLVQVGKGKYVLPLLSVEECLELRRAEADKARERSMIPFRGEIISYISLREQFRADNAAPDIEKVVVMESGKRRVGLGVDKVIGQHQTVIKTLGKFYKNIKTMSGATILGDGSVALIPDVDQLVRKAQEKFADTGEWDPGPAFGE